MESTRGHVGSNVFAGICLIMIVCFMKYMHLVHILYTLLCSSVLLGHGGLPRRQGGGRAALSGWGANKSFNLLEQSKVEGGVIVDVTYCN